MTRRPLRLFLHPAIPTEKAFSMAPELRGVDTCNLLCARNSTQGSSPTTVVIEGRIAYEVLHRVLAAVNRASPII